MSNDLNNGMKNYDDEDEFVAIIACAGRFPGAKNTQELWKNLLAGVDAIQDFSDARISAAGLDPKAVRADASHVSAGGILGDVDQFDPEFFGYNPQEATLTDPQHRLLLEVSWEALEAAGYDAERFNGAIGVFAGKAKSQYLSKYLLPSREQTPGVEDVLSIIGNETDYLSTNISYRLGLKGPSISVHTACSTSLVAIHHAKQSLLNYESDMALAGGVCIRLPEGEGYIFNEGNIMSSDGHTRTFDENADGTNFSNGAAMVVLKRLSEARADGDNIIAVIKGSAINNDGADRMGFMAPSVQGQADVILMAQADAGVSPDDISYVETHGTATALGDPIEIAALTQAFRAEDSQQNQYCGLGSLKSNLGHLDAAAGVSGFIKTALALKNKTLPATINFTKVNPKFNIETTPFYINDKLKPWNSEGRPRIAAISSFGAGGTNAHVILSEAPKTEPSSSTRPYQLLQWSAPNVDALEPMANNLRAHLESAENLDFADSAYTLQVGRKQFSHRQFLACRDKDHALDLMTNKKTFKTKTVESGDAETVFMFPGQGSQYINMALEFYKHEPVFKHNLDYCCSVLDPILGKSLLALLYPETKDAESASEQLSQTAITQPALFAIEFSMAKLWMSWGVLPVAMIGHSIGEYVAACLADVLNLDDALQIIAKRGELIQALPYGDMLAVKKPVQEIKEILNSESLSELSIAAINTFNSCVVAGEEALVAQLKEKLDSEKIGSRILHTSHAFHSSMMEPILKQFADFVAQFKLSAPTVPFISSVSGSWISDETASDPNYWAEHIRSTVQFAKGRETLFLDAKDKILLEVGPGNALTSIARDPEFKASSQTIVSSVGHARDNEDEGVNLMEALGTLWASGAKIDWSAYYENERRLRVALPTYPFQRKSYWVKVNSNIVKSALVANGLLSQTESTTVSESSVDNSSEVVAGIDRKTHLINELRKLLSDLSGMEESELEIDVSFLKLGFDSLFLTQASTAFKKAFGISISFRQLLDSTSTIDALATFLDEKLEADKFQPTASVTAKNPLVVGESPANEINALAVTDTTTPEARAKMEQELAQDIIQDKQRHGPWKQIDKSIKASVKDSHRRGLDELISAYTKKTPGSKALIQKHRAHFADPRTISGFNNAWKEMVYPIITERSAGSCMWDIDGNEYLDIQSGFGSVLFGQNADFIREAIAKQLEKGTQIGPQSKFAGEVAEKICKIAGMDRVTFCNTGSEAVLAAMRVSRTVTGNNKIVMFSGDYHGIFDDVVARPASTSNKLKTLPAAPGIPKESLSNTVVLEFGDPSCFDTLNAIAGDVAAILVEPVQSRKPDLQPVEFLKQLRIWTQENSVPLIFDEVITGMRIHPRGAQGWYGIDADMVTYGKIIGGGMPAGVLAGRKQYMDALDGGDWQYGDDSFPEVGVTYFAGTFVRHPLMIAAANAVADKIANEGEQLYTALNKKADRLADSLNEYFEDNDVPLHLQHCGSMMVIEFLAELEYNALFFYQLRLSGIFLLDGGSFFINMSHSEEDIDRLITGFKDAAKFMLKNEFFPTIQKVREFPLTKSQQEIWLATQVGDDANCAYNLSSTIEFEGDLDVERLKRALVKMLNTNDALRLSISNDGMAKVGDKVKEVACFIDDLSPFNEAQQKQSIAEAAGNDVETPFDLETGPLIRFKLFKLASSKYLLFISNHHLVSDGWSCGVITHRLGELYNTSASKTLKAKPIAMQFSEYAQWLQAPEQLKRREEDHDYWTSLHADTAPDLDLPLDFTRPPIKTYSARQVSIKMETGLIDKVNSFSRQQGATPFAFLLSAFELLIYRISAQPQFNIGVPAAGHMQVGDHNLVGHCVNFLPLKCSINAEKSFYELMNTTQNHVFEAFEHQFFTYGELVNSLGLNSEPSRNALISIVFNVDKIDGVPEYEGLKVKVGTNERHFEMFEMFLNIVVAGSEMILECVYNADLFTQTAVERWLRLYEQIVCKIIDGDSAFIQENSLQNISIISDQEKSKLLVEWNKNKLAIPSDCNILSLIDKQAGLFPSNEAVIANGKTLNYKDLLNRSNQLARYLKNKGVQPGSLLGLCVDRSVDMVVALLAILRCGCAYVPLDPEYPKDRLEYMVEDASLAMLVIQSDYRHLFAKAENFIELDLENNEIAAESIDPITTKLDENQTAYIIYTSGSTGKPKGVEIPHRALTNFLISMAIKPGLSKEDRLLAVTTLSFDIAVLELYLPLTLGATVVVATSEQATDGVRLLEILIDNAITCMQSTPARWRMLIEAGLEKRNNFKALCGGEALPQDLSAKLVKLSSELWNMYGPTETTVWSTVFKISDADHKVLIGRAIHNTDIYILDTALQAVPIGVPGELYIGGLGVAKGYLNRPELNAERFINNPFNNEPGSKLYRTGDLVRYLDTGEIEYFNRLDNQIKIRGFRIEIGEIESALAEHSRIGQTAVTLKTFGADDVRLVAYYKILEGKAITNDELKAFMGTTLPEYMVPSFFVELETFPLTPSGKIDRKNLPDVNLDENLKEYVAPQSDLEKTLAAIWADILGLTKVGLEDNFFDLGGHSLLAVKLSSRIRERFGVNLNLRMLFTNPALKNQCLFIEGLSPVIETSQDDGDREDFVI